MRTARHRVAVGRSDAQIRRRRHESCPDTCALRGRLPAPLPPLFAHQLSRKSYSPDEILSSWDRYLAKTSRDLRAGWGYDLLAADDSSWNDAEYRKKMDLFRDGA